MTTTSSLTRECIAELIGAFILVFFGIGAVHGAVFAGSQSGIWQVSIVFGVAVTVAIYAIGAVSGAHINPAITLSLVVHRGFPFAKALFYIGSQVLGAFLAAATLHALLSGAALAFEANGGITRGAPGSELSAMVYGCYFPNPAVAKAMNWPEGTVTQLQAMLAEGIGTALLAFFVFALTDSRNAGGPGGSLAPLFIGLVVAILISVIAPITECAINPARDFGPRLFAYFAGWGEIAIPGPRGGFFTVYILAPILGALAGSSAYVFLVQPREREA